MDEVLRTLAEVGPRDRPQGQRQPLRLAEAVTAETALATADAAYVALPVGGQLHQLVPRRVRDEEVPAGQEQRLA
ncbi:hypothetical protein ACFWA0_36795, partial [Streptomyces xanthophaeus]|uniref:hypothetical protein n=1 Tax=Streptomyces xanthophaeus TaxID=67385 RepID=UPI00364CE5BF